MTDNLLLESAISLGALVMMVLAVWLVFKTPPQMIAESSARARLAFDEPDFAPVEWVFDKAGGAALAEGRAGEYALVFRHGADLVTRRFGAGDGVAVAQGAALTIAQTDPGSRAITLRSDDASRWAHKISGPRR